MRGVRGGVEPPRKRLRMPGIENMRSWELDIVFSCVWPHIVALEFGEEDENFIDRTFQALRGVCRALWYDMRLQRVVQLRKAGLAWTRRFSENTGRERDHFVQEITDFLAGSGYFNASQLFSLVDNAGPDHFNVRALGGIEFADTVTLEHDMVTTPRSPILCFRARTFAEMCLFCLAACLVPANDIDVETFLVVGTWPVPNAPNALLFEKKDRATTMKKVLLGRLRHLGATAPQSYAFINRIVPHTDYSWFMEHCDTSGKRNKLTPIQRLTRFVDGWYSDLRHSHKPEHVAQTLRPQFIETELLVDDPE